MKDGINPMHSSARCGARTRRGMPCRSPTVTDRKRCRMHGGAAGSGAPKGNQNALKHGRYSGAAIAFRREMRGVLNESRRVMEMVTS